MVRGSLECGASWVRNPLAFVVIVARLLIVSAFLAAGQVNAGDLDASAVDRLARQILTGIKPPARLAIRPLGKGRSGLPVEIADRLDGEVLAAVRRAAPRGVVLVARSDLAAAWGEAIEFADRNVQDLLREARADILIIGEATALRSGLELSYRAVSLKDGMTGRVVSAPRPIMAESPDLDLDDLRFHQTLWRTADELALAAASMVAPGDAGKVVDVVAGGGGGAFADHVRNLARGRMQDLLGRRLTTVAAPLNAPPPGRTVLHLSLEILDQGDAVSITYKLNGPGVAESRVARLETALIPVHFLPLTRDGGKVGSGMFQARGGAWSNQELSSGQTGAAARALARARVIASALGLAMPISKDVGTAQEMVALRRMMERGIPYDEVWVSDVTGADGDVAVNLRALVRAVGGPSSPSIGIAFAGADLKAGQTLKLLISAKRRTAHVAVFSWDGDDGVQRLYPAGGTTAIRVESGRTLALPPALGPEYGVVPPLGQKVAVESLIVLASAVPFETAGLGTIPRAIGRASPFQARPVSRFLDALARMDLEVMKLRILDYRVRDVD